jgi:hypothetical protein
VQKFQKTLLKPSPVDLGDAAIDLAPMEGSNTDDLESNHRVISNCAVIRI